MQISVMLSNLNLPFEEALSAVSAMGIPAVQVTITKDDDAARRRMMKQSILARDLKFPRFAWTPATWAKASPTSRMLKP